MSNKLQKTNIESAYTSIKSILENARSKAYRAINLAMVEAYWNIGRVIVEEEQKGEKRAEYGKALVVELSKRLNSDFGSSFNERNVWYIRSFYLVFPNMNALRSELSWTHYRLLLRIEKEEARNFYTIESISNNWSTREFERQINSLLYERRALSKDKNEVKTRRWQGILCLRITKKFLHPNISYIYQQKSN